MKKVIWIVIATLLTISLTDCGHNINKQGNKENISTSNKMDIYTTVFAFQSFADQIWGKYVNVKSIYSTGPDIHTFEPMSL